MGYYTGGDNCYGRGDYYRGDYYRGDPGIFSFVGKALGGVAKAALGLIPGPAGTLARAIAKPLTNGNPKQGTALAPLPPGLPPLLQQPGPGGASIPGGISPEQATQILQMRQLGYVCGPDGARRGHLNKSTYITRGGGTSRWPQTVIIHRKHTECVGPRRMNVANPRALRRALRRAQGFAKLARRYIAVSKHFKKGKRGRKR